MTVLTLFEKKLSVLLYKEKKTVNFNSFIITEYGAHQRQNLPES